MKENIKYIFIPFVLVAVSFSSQASDYNHSIQDKNKDVVIKFYEDFFNKHEVDKSSLVIDDKYIQHNPFVSNGKKPFIEYFREFFKENPKSRADIVRSVADGDLVWLHVRSSNGDSDRGQAVVDIFRLKDGKIVEHWDVSQDVPEKSSNNNTMF